MSSEIKETPTELTSPQATTSEDIVENPAADENLQTPENIEEKKPASASDLQKNAATNIDENILEAPDIQVTTASTASETTNIEEILEPNISSPKLEEKSNSSVKTPTELDEKLDTKISETTPDSEENVDSNIADVENKTAEENMESDENLESPPPAAEISLRVTPDLVENMDTNSQDKLPSLETADLEETPVLKATPDLEGTLAAEETPDLECTSDLKSTPDLEMTSDLKETLDLEKTPDLEETTALISASPSKSPLLDLDENLDLKVSEEMSESSKDINLESKSIVENKAMETSTIELDKPDVENIDDESNAQVDVSKEPSELTDVGKQNDMANNEATTTNETEKPLDDNIVAEENLKDQSKQSEDKKTVDTPGDVTHKVDVADAVIHKDDVGESENKEEPAEIIAMDTCDSQESINLIIDETSDTAENKDDKTETDMEIDTTNEKPTKAAEASSKVTVELTPAEKLNNLLETLDSIDKEFGVTTTKDKPRRSQEGKDDDVITIEQPMPVIEIDDEDDEDKDMTEKEKPKDLEKPMEIDDDESMPEVIEKSATTGAQKNKPEESVDSLLAVVAEKSMEEVLKEAKESKDDNEDTIVEIFSNKECINYECAKKHKQFFRVPQFAFSYFKVNKKKFKTQYICADCYDKALDMYEEFCGLISAKQPLLLENIPNGRQEFVEIIDSSDEEDTPSSNSKSVETTNSTFSKNDLQLIENELHNTIKSVLNRVEIQNQLTWSKTILGERLKRLEMETDFIDNELKSLQRKADKMHEGLYSCPKIKIRQLQPLDLNSGKIMGLDGPHAEMQPIPPVGEIERQPIQVNGSYYAVKNNAIASWVPCKVIEQVEGGMMAQKNVKYYRIKFLNKSQHTMTKTVPSKYLAFYDPPAVRLPIGTRVIAYFDATSLARGREKINVQSAFYPGIIAEPLKPNNKFRYLIFYDDGYTQYVYHKDVRLVCMVSENVWEDVHPASRDFIQKYLTQYSINRPMVQTQKGQSMNTESNGYWLHARVVDIDCSLVLMQFEGSKSHTEWIYRGSLRLGPVFKEYQKTLQKNSSMPISRLSRRTEPFIRYTEDEDASTQQQQQQSDKANDNRAVARKTFGRPESMMNTAQPATQQQHQQTLQPVKHLNNSTIYVEDENKPKGKVVYYTAKRNLPPRKYRPHECKPSCLFEITHNLSAYSPLSKPLLSGWERFIIRQKIKKVVTYRAPCGKILRNMKELRHYLRLTNNLLNVDNFDFSHETNCLAEYVIESAIIQKKDISLGQEKMPIPLVNYYDNTLPPECKYSAKVIPTEGVHINTDSEFFAGCDCDDDCSDKSKCSCWQLTLSGAKYGNPNTPPEEVGYQYKRLMEHVPTGIYECNPRCKCRSNCLNRVVQHSLQIKLQVFKTSNRGWGLRCINDVPRGSFVCVYAGHLLTEAKANEGGQDAGDEYFAELDYIEVAEQIKEGYESDVEPPEPDDEDPYQPEEDDEFTPSKSFLTRSKRHNAMKSTTQSEDSQERQAINFNPSADMNEDSVRENSIRKLYGNDEACYVMDAKISGNLGRYFNHSCAPNMFVQNVFVDTHDLRFPWVAFFSSCYIRAGTELTWNYNYEVGVVPGKVLYCQCGAANCRLRLL